MHAEATVHAAPASPPTAVRSPLDSLRNALIVTRREMRDSLRDWRIMLPIFMMTLVFPALAQAVTRIFTNFFVSNGAEPLIDNFLPLLPMIVGFFPVSMSLVIALETFVGEKERRSLEPLLSTPLTNTELYIGKTLAATMTPLLASYMGIGVYLGGLVLGEQQWRPEAELVLQILALTTAQALVMVTGAVVISSQTTSTRASNLLASFIIIPISLLVMFESFVMITNQRFVLWYFFAALIIAVVLFVSMGARIFNREELLGRAIDQINLRWAWRRFWNQMRGGAEVTGVLSWYRDSVVPVLGQLRKPALVVSIALAGVFLGGLGVALVRPDLTLPSDLLSVSRGEMVENLRFVYTLGNGQMNVGAVVMQNVRVLAVGTLLGTFTFGVMAMFFAGLPFGIIGFLLAQPLLASVGIGVFLVALVPHSLLEIPAIVIATAAALRLGAIVTHPPQGMGVWEAWLRAAADVVKVDVAVVLPLLILAATVEVYITPRLVLAALGG